MPWKSEKAGTEHYDIGEFDAFKDGVKVDVDRVAIRRSAVENREDLSDDESDE